MDIIQFKKFVNNDHRCLSIISRFNFKSKLHQESVASHSFYTTLYASMISDILISYYPIKTELVLKMALVHDAEEVVLGDVLATTKIAIKETYNKLAESVVDDILFDYAQYWKNYNNTDCLECIVVKFADKISGISFCKSEIELGNKLFLSILKEYRVVIIKFNSYRYPNQEVYNIFSELINFVIFDIDNVLKLFKNNK